MKIVTILGARPQFIKASVVSREIKKYSVIKEIIIHTGQHFDYNMSKVFFDEMNIPKPNYNLNINSLPHGAMTGRMMEKIEMVLKKEKPDWVLVYGDTNSTIAGALAAKKMHIKVAHVEAGLRSYNMKMPEEINRILTDRISNILFCPTQNSVNNLYNEGFKNIYCDIVKCGDVMYDAALLYSKKVIKPDFNIPEQYSLATIHRQENTNNIDRLKNIFEALNELSKELKTIIPIHPRTNKLIKDNNEIKLSNNIILVEPVSYLEMLWLLKNCRMVLTDSGGVQKEAYYNGKKCVTLREETEWKELVDIGVNIVSGYKKNNIIDGYNKLMNKNFKNENLYGNGNASEIIVNKIFKNKLL